MTAVASAVGLAGHWAESQSGLQRLEGPGEWGLLGAATTLRRFESVRGSEPRALENAAPHRRQTAFSGF